jgi:hypothetical protein
MRAIRALLLVLALSAYAYAGEMPCGRTGEIPLGGKIGEMPTDKTGAIDPITETALQLLQSILPLF